MTARQERRLWRHVESIENFWETLLETGGNATPSTCDETGSSPIDNVIVSADGSTLYGMTQNGGAADQCNDNGYGTVFSIAAIP